MGFGVQRRMIVLKCGGVVPKNLKSNDSEKKFVVRSLFLVTNHVMPCE